MTDNRGNPLALPNVIIKCFRTYFLRPFLYRDTALPCPAREGEGKHGAQQCSQGSCTWVQGTLGTCSLRHCPSLPQTNARFDHTSKHLSSAHPHTKSFFPPSSSGLRGSPTHMMFVCSELKVIDSSFLFFLGKDSEKVKFLAHLSVKRHKRTVKMMGINFILTWNWMEFC